MAIRLTIRHQHVFQRGGSAAVRIVGMEMRHHLEAIATRIALKTLDFYTEDQGTYKEALRVDPVRGRGTQIRTTVSNRARHAATLEDGRGANKTPPPVDAIVGWLVRKGITPDGRPQRAKRGPKTPRRPSQRKGRPTKKRLTKARREQVAYLRKIGVSDRQEKQLRQLAFLIARKIGEKGQPPKAPMAKSVGANTSFIRASVGQGTRNVVRALNEYAGS